MPDLNFDIESAEAHRLSAAPQLLFKLRIAEAVAASRALTPIHTVLLRCQIRIEPARRRYIAAEQERLLDLFGTPERWSQTLRPLQWTQVSIATPPFTGACVVDLPVPCSFDFSLAATKYFEAMEADAIPLCFLFSGTIFYRAGDNVLQVGQVAWDKEAYFRLPAATWREVRNMHYPDGTWLHLRRDVFDRLNQYRSRLGLPNWEQTLEKLLSAEEAVKP